MTEANWWIEREDEDEGGFVYHLWTNEPVRWICSFSEASHDDAKVIADRICATLNLADALRGPDAFMLNQIATYIGGMVDAFGLKNQERAVGEEYFSFLHDMGDKLREATPKIAEVEE
jgi:hypothetical protein